LLGSLFISLWVLVERVLVAGAGLVPREQGVAALAGDGNFFGPQRSADASLGAVREMGCERYTPGAIVEPQVVVRVVRFGADREDFALHNAQSVSCASRAALARQNEEAVAMHHGFFIRLFPGLSFRAHPSCFSQLVSTFPRKVAGPFGHSRCNFRNIAQPT